MLTFRSLNLSGIEYVFLSNTIAAEFPLISASPYTIENELNSPIDTKNNIILAILLYTIKPQGRNNKTLLLFYSDSNNPRFCLMNKSDYFSKKDMLLVGLVLTLLLGFTASAEPIPDYRNPYAPIFTDKEVYTWTDKIRITIVAPSWNVDRYGIDSIGTQEGHLIKISTSDKELEPYKLAETEPSSGTFSGEVILTGFSHDVDGDGKSDTNPRTIGNGPTGGFLETERDGGITISFEFADGVVLTQSVKVSWNIGNVKFMKPDYAIGETAIIRVVDIDMNLNPEAGDQGEVEVSSDSDGAGILVNVIETSDDSGLFEAAISFTQNQASSGNRLFANPGDSLYVKYDDYTLPSPYSISDTGYISRVDSKTLLPAYPD